MDLVTQTSLEALILKATNPQNQNVDMAAVEAFYTLVNKEKDGAHIGVKVIASRLPSGNEKEVLQTLNVLDICMMRCGTHFQNEVGKFRFLNEMIKLVSPKYLGSHTPMSVKQKVLQLLYVWTLDYPKEAKIKEAFDMLRKQGVIREIPNPNVAIENINIPKRRQTLSVFHDEEKSKILQRLLQSKDPEDIQAANWLIKSMVKEDDKKSEIKSKTISEVETALSNVRLLNEMLDSYKPGVSSEDELELIKELYQSCERLEPNISKLMSVEDGVIDIVHQTNNELKAGLEKYYTIIVEGKIPEKQIENTNHSLLDFEQTEASLVEGASKSGNVNRSDEKCTIDVLCDIFTNTSIPDSADILQPVSVIKCDKPEQGREKDKFKALEELDVLGEHLIKENLKSTSNFSKSQEKIPMNLLTKLNELKNQSILKESTSSEPYSYADLDRLVKEPCSDKQTKNKNSYVDLSLLDKAEEILNRHKMSDSLVKPKINDDVSDDCLVDITDEKMLGVSDEDAEQNMNKSYVNITDKTKMESQSNGKSIESSAKVKSDVKLSEIYIKLEDIKPSKIPPMTVLDEKNGISVTLHFTKDKPKESVHVFVVTTISKNDLPLSNYLFQAVVPKGCKIKLQPPSTTELPSFNPFLPPKAITQIMLLSNPDNVQISLKFIISYIMDDETITEMGEVENLPMVV